DGVQVRSSVLQLIAPAQLVLHLLNASLSACLESVICSSATYGDCEIQKRASLLVSDDYGCSPPNLQGESARSLLCRSSTKGRHPRPESRCGWEGWLVELTGGDVDRKGTERSAQLENFNWTEELERLRRATNSR